MNKALDQILGMVSAIDHTMVNSLECINSPAQLAYLFLLSLAPSPLPPFVLKFKFGEWS